jgi:hypothetical protein
MENSASSGCTAEVVALSVSNLDVGGGSETFGEEKLLSISMLWNWWQERSRGNHDENHQSVDN